MIEKVYGFPFGFPYINGAEYEDSKLNHDRYEVYVNGDYIGNKTLLVRNEQIDDINDFLYEQGFKQFNSAADGDHFEITAMEGDHEIKEALQMYLQNR